MVNPRRIEKKEKIKIVSTHLFAQKGFHATSTREIAKEVGINQATLYHYFHDKEEILFRVMNDAVEDALETLMDIKETDATPIEKAKKILNFYTIYYAGNQERLILLTNESESLKEEHRLILIKKERAYLRLFKGIFDELIKNNQMKKISSSVATFAFLGMVHYTINWYRKDGPIGLNELADLFEEIFTKGILDT